MKTDSTFALWPIPPFGGEDGDDQNGTGNDGAQGNSGAGSAGDSAGSSSNSKSSAGSKGGDDDGDDDEFFHLSEAELKALAKESARKLKEAEKEKKKAQELIEAEERKKNDEATNLRKDLEKAQGENATLRATVAKQAIEAAIRDDDRWAWHDVEMVASLATKLNADITVSDDGKVEGLKATLPKIAKQHPFLVKSSKDSNGNQGDSRNGDGPTGFQPGQGGTSGGSGSEIDTKALAENYPVLADRI